MKKIFYRVLGKNKASFGVWLGMLWLTAAGVAWAQPRVSVHPLVAEQGLRGLRWNALFMQEAAKQKIAMTPEPRVAEALKQHQGSCQNDLECLAKLGRATKAYYVVAVNMYKTETGYTVRARIIQSNRPQLTDSLILKEVGPLNIERVSKVDEDKNVRAVYARLFADLKLATLSTQPGFSLEEPQIIEKEVIVEKPVDRPIEVIEVPRRGFVKKTELVEELHQKTSPMRISAYALLGTAAAAAVTGTVFVGLTDDSFRKYKKLYGNDLKTIEIADALENREGVLAAIRLKDEVALRKTIAIVALSAAGAAAIAGLTLFFLSPERYLEKNLKVGLAPTDGGAMLSVQGVLP